MMGGGVARPVAIIAGGGSLPALMATAAVEQGRQPLVFAIDGEADAASLAAFQPHDIRWGEIGRMLRLAKAANCAEAVLIGRIERRPDFQSLRPDVATVKLLPRIVKLLREGDEGLLAGVARLFHEQGIALVGPLDVAPALAMPAGLLAGATGPQAAQEIARAAEAARTLGRLDIGQSAVAVGGRVVAVEDAGGTADLLERVAVLRATGRIARGGGVLVKCAKPQQDLRLDVPTIGAATASEAHAAGLDGVAAEAGRALIAGRSETVEAFRARGLFLLGLDGAGSDHGG
jgi:UDP-2,3-diacylglucosamine hydrolase